MEEICMTKKTLSLILVLLLALLPLLACAEGMEATVTEIQKYGNLMLSVKASELLEAGYTYGDVVTIDLDGQILDMVPVGSNFTDVEQGSLLVRLVYKEDPAEDYVLLAINMGDLATTAGIATKEKIEETPGYIWKMNEGVSDPVPVTITMKEKAGYYDEWMIHQLIRSENREDYPDLSDEQYANFRAITTTGIGAGKLYRSSSPVNPEINRNTYADKAAEAAGIKTFMNLADSLEIMQGYEGFSDTYYSKQAYIALNLGVDFTAADFQAGLVKGLRFLSEHDTPFLVHCNEGKDRAGFTSAILECLMGASEEEIVEDYMVTFYNYYGVQPGTEQYDIIARSNIRKSLAVAFGVKSLEGMDLKQAAENYLKLLGMTEEEITALRTKLAEE